jgi:outer membrane protein TolC
LSPDEDDFTDEPTWTADTAPGFELADVRGESDASNRDGAEEDVAAGEFHNKYDIVPLGASQHPIDLPSALRLAGAENWSIQLAHERIHEAQAELAEAEAMWLPSINLGIGYTKHEGKIQATTGDVIDVSRDSLFLGGGAVNQNGPVAGGSGGPARLMVDLSLTDALYEPLARCQRVNAAKARQNTVFNETLTSVALAYYELIGAQGRLSLENQNIKDANSVLDLTKAFVAAGKAPESEVNRVSVAAGIREQSAIRAELAIKRASSDLARLLQLDFRQMPSGFVLICNESSPAPINWVTESADLQALIAQGLGVRPEVHQLQASVAELNSRVAAEQVRPFIPNLHLGLSGGMFSGGTGGSLADTGSRADVDALLVWQMKNLGYGNRAVLAQRLSQQRQAVLRRHQVEDLIAAEITQAWQTVQAQRESIQLAEENITQAVRVYESNLLRIRGLEGLPLEALLALQALATARVAWLDAVVAYNKAQVMLLKAIGRPIDCSSQPIGWSPETGNAATLQVDELQEPALVPDIPDND